MSKEDSTFLDLNNPPVPGLKPLDIEKPSQSEKLPPTNAFTRFRHRYKIDYVHQRKKLLIIGILIIDVFLFLLARLFLSKPNSYQIGRIFMFLMFEMTLFLGSLFIYRRITSIFIKSGRWQRGLKISLAVFAGIWILMAHISWLFYNLSIPSDFFLPVLCFLALGAYFHCFVFLLIFFIIERVSNLFLRSKKIFILQSKTFHTLFAIGLALFLTMQGYISTFQRPTIKTLNIPLQNLPSEFEHFSIALISDIHIGPTVGKSRVEEIVEIVNGFDADVITIAGDLVDGYIDYIGDRVLPLKELKSKYGTFASLGNHEYIHENVDHWIEFFRNSLNLTVLVNSGAVLSKDGKQLCISGVDDFFTETAQIEGHKMDTEKAISKCPSNASTIMLVHQPNGVAKVLTTLETINRKVDLILSGHTHAGQMFIVWPIGILVNHFFYGLYLYPPSGTQIYVSSGVNYWGPPIKMFPSLCEIVKIRLHRA